eukprot:GDKK01076882.1.p1 GENE.GDKK01076882.1~~GDKK01076882.1.p1  ORF type:complete len:200 (+),score=37.98 GDKK01076882.1:64-663(+)
MTRDLRRRQLYPWYFFCDFCDFQEGWADDLAPLKNVIFDAIKTVHDSQSTEETLFMKKEALKKAFAQYRQVVIDHSKLIENRMNFERKELENWNNDVQILLHHLKTVTSIRKSESAEAIAQRTEMQYCDTQAKVVLGLQSQETALSKVQTAEADVQHFETLKKNLTTNTESMKKLLESMKESISGKMKDYEDSTASIDG